MLESQLIDFQPKLSVVKAAELLEVSVQAVHKQLKQKNITCPKTGNKSYGFVKTEPYSSCTS